MIEEFLMFCFLILNKESNEMEFKSAKVGFPESLWETYPSFANIQRDEW